ncbi:hypothetical protein [Azoarcus sp. KH32C]|uniref:hypothetical protein n=1 Tax=Azoarcus sp. KH32C TaxID=748247 RepID=UPI0002386465|nr:hypothetical protein [Azoarcus sp. KH32C]BAL22523.1 hypothetical protein AZKH_0177 [Azoarcus sp. KH32C]
MRNPIASSVVSLCLLGGCASQGVSLQEGTVLLGEVSHTVTERDVAANRIGPETTVADLAHHMRRLGFTKEQIAAGRVVAVRERIYWHTVVSGIRHDDVFLALVPEGMSVKPGDIVEKALQRPPTIVRVRARSQADAHCRFEELPTGDLKGVTGMLRRVGPSGAATLYCEGIEKEGWVRLQSYWHKPPPGSAESDEQSM